MMGNETKTIEQIFYEYLKSSAGEVNIDSVKIRRHLRRYSLDEKEQLHSLKELIEKIEANLSLADGVDLLEILFHLCLENSELEDFVCDFEFLIKTIKDDTEDIKGDLTIYQLFKDITKFTESKIEFNDVKDLKNDFKDKIDSERTLDNIHTFSQLFAILEERDALNIDDIRPFEYIIENLDENNDVKTIKRMLDLFKKLSSHHYCRICNVPIEFIPVSTFNMSNISTNDKSMKRSEQEKNELQAAINYMSKYLGPSWKNLARALDIYESKIQSIEYENNRNVEEQIHQMFIFWRDEHDNLTVDALVTALKSPLCNKNHLATKIENKEHLQFL